MHKDAYLSFNKVTKVEPTTSLITKESNLLQCWKKNCIDDLTEMDGDLKGFLRVIMTRDYVHFILPLEWKYCMRFFPIFFFIESFHEQRLIEYIHCSLHSNVLFLICA